MPCGDISETIRLELDGNDKLLDYTFSKRACGGNIGQKSMLLDQLKGFSARQIIDLEQSKLLDMLNPENSTEGFLAIKHLTIMQTCFLMLYGEMSNKTRNPVRIYSINHTPNGIELEADVKLNLDVKKIDPCNNCGCGL